MSDRDKVPDLQGPAAPGSPPPQNMPSDKATPELDEEMEGVLDEADLRDLLRSALAPPSGAVAPSILPGVQRKLRRRSRGKFYGDGWSTARAPRSTYLVTSIVMLLLLAFVFLVLIPWGGGALP